MKFTPTDEQLKVAEFVELGQQNLLVNARAGAAKTSTLELVAARLPKATGLAIAFNVSIKDELSTRLPSNFECRTMNSIGHRAIGSFLGRRLTLIKNKTYRLCRDFIDGLPSKPEQDEAFAVLGDTMKLISAAKQRGFVHALRPSTRVRPICDEDEYLDAIDMVPTELQLSMIRAITAESFRLMLEEGVVDFDDQILGAALFKCSFDNYSHIFVDEAQDLSPLQHLILEKMVKRKTFLLVVGDPCQAIYGFRGADSNSMPNMKNRFDMHELFLTICFRCPQEVIKAAQWRAPDMRWPENAKVGEVRTLSAWNAEDIPDGSAILCRNNAPLFSMALRLLTAGRAPEFLGRDVIATIGKLMKDLGKPTHSREISLANLGGWVAKQKLRDKNQSRVMDQVACMRLFIERTETLKDACDTLARIGSASGRIKLATGHKAKGLEFPQVFFLDQDLCRVKKDQDRNIKYVIQTRAQETLTYVTSEGWVGQEPVYE